MNDLASPLDDELGRIRRAIASLAWYDRSHLGRLRSWYCMGIFGTAPQYRTYQKGRKWLKKSYNRKLRNIPK